MSHRNKPSRPILCYVTDRSLLPVPPEAPLRPLLAKIADAQAAGIDWIQIREKDLSARDCLALTRFAIDQAPILKADSRPVEILLNDRLDIALTTGAAGVHLGESGLPVGAARTLADASRPASQKPFLIGASCHSLDAARLAAREGADYIFFGPIFETPSKVAFGPPQGLARLAEVCSAVAIPVLAIGGINLANAASCMRAGATGIAAIRLFQDASNLPTLAAALHALQFREHPPDN